MVAGDVGTARSAQLQRCKDSARAGGIAWTPACGSGAGRQFRHHVSANGGSSGFLDSAPKACGILETDDAGVAGNFALTLEARCGCNVGVVRDDSECAGPVQGVKGLHGHCPACAPSQIL
jgi:hypothetical protein